MRNEDRKPISRVQKVKLQRQTAIPFFDHPCTDHGASSFNQVGLKDLSSLPQLKPQGISFDDLFLVIV